MPPNKDLHRGTADCFTRAGKIGVLVHTGTALKAAALYAVASQPVAALPLTVNNVSMTIMDGRLPLPPTTSAGVGVALWDRAVTWALDPPPWEP